MAKKQESNTNIGSPIRHWYHFGSVLSNIDVDATRYYCSFYRDILDLFINLFDQATPNNMQRRVTIPA
jgi:hypothetical protein